jgi:iron complex outermembrane receptor protein
MESLLKTFKAAALCGCITYLTAAGAQETTLKIGAEDEGQKMPQKKVEKIQVTGSHIKRIDIEGPSPVQTIDKQELDETGYNSVADVLRNVSANSFGSRREQAGSTVAGVAEVSLRGLGASSTLVLMNGRRLPTDGVTGAVDLNLIPMAAVERVEILKDGASAIYGSDAIGGVVNIITKRDYVGTEMSFQHLFQILKAVKRLRSV